MSFTTSAANDVKKAYMQLQHEFSDIVLDFESMPDPAKCGKKREGFNIYKQEVENRKCLALEKINYAGSECNNFTGMDSKPAIESYEQVNSYNTSIEYSADGFKTESFYNLDGKIIRKDNYNGRIIKRIYHDADGTVKYIFKYTKKGFSLFSF